MSGHSKVVAGDHGFVDTQSSAIQQKSIFKLMFTLIEYSLISKKKIVEIYFTRFSVETLVASFAELQREREAGLTVS